MQREVLSPLARILLGGDAVPGSTIVLDAVPVETTGAKPDTENPVEAQKPEMELVFAVHEPSVVSESATAEESQIEESVSR